MSERFGTENARQHDELARAREKKRIKDAVVEQKASWRFPSLLRLFPIKKKPKPDLKVLK